MIFMKESYLSWIFTYFAFFEILRIIPILIILTTRLLPPYDMKGSVTPVIGTNPTTTLKFKSVWKISRKERPNIRYFANKSVWDIADFIRFK